MSSGVVKRIILTKLYEGVCSSYICKITNMKINTTWNNIHFTVFVLLDARKIVIAEQFESTSKLYSPT